jgi:hypothetical protein
MTRTLRALLTTWETWTSRDVLRRATLATRHVEEDLDQLDMFDGPTVTPLDALTDATELIGLLSGWRWQAVYAARVEQGATWDEIGRATGVSAEQAEADHGEAVERQERYGGRDGNRYRAAL